MKTRSWFCFMAMLAWCDVRTCSGAEDADTRVLVQCLLPATRDFVRRHQLPLDPGFATNDINYVQIHWVTNDHTDKVLGFVRIKNRFTFNVDLQGGVVQVTYYQLIKPSLIGASRYGSKEMVELLGKTNLLNESSALAVARNHFLLQGHQEKNFHPPFFHQIIYGDKRRRASDYVELPIYVAEWVRRDQPYKTAHERQTIIPEVVMWVSGVSSNVEYYSTSELPIGRDFEPNHQYLKKTPATSKVR